MFLDKEHLKEFWPGSTAVCPSTYKIEEISKGEANQRSLKFQIFKTGFDYGAAILVLPLIGVLTVILFLINPFVNKGPVFFVQDRMGRDLRLFRMIKFRTMTKGSNASRDPNAKLEEDRITALGRFMRKSRIDELPNFINVLRGEMSVVGPRPDAFNHALHFTGSVDGYRARHRVKPGITGLAQVEMGYVVGEEATRQKATYDNIYVKRHCGRLDVYIIYRTFFVMARALGS